MSTWGPLLAACAAVFALKLAGHLVPTQLLSGPRVSRITMLLPVALLAALVAVQTLDGGGEVMLDARAAALAAAAFALLLRAPFLVVLLVAALVAAGLRALGWAS